jgi:opacity protein-like surface antigen
MRIRCVLGLTVAVLLLRPAPAAADLTAFLGLSSSPTSRPASGLAVGFGALVIGVEGEYSHTKAREADDAPSLDTGMLNVLLATPTRTQLYLTAGVGLYREAGLTGSVTDYGTNIGGGIKIALASVLRLRLDYRVLTLHGAARYRNPQRLYAGLNLTF